VALLNVLRRRRALIVWSSVACAVLFTGIALLANRTWTTSTSFFPQGKKATGNLSALAAQFGVPVGSADANESPAFYADLVKSRAILSTVIDSGIAVKAGRAPVNIADAYDVKNSNPLLRRELAMKKLADNISVATNVKTGVVTMKVTSPSPDLSQTISSRLLDLLNRFNQDTRRGQASAERKFTEERLAVVKRELRAAEDAQQNFLQTNRVNRAPQLQAQQDRIEREVRMQQDLYTGLAKSYEQAKIEEVRDTPVITVVEQPEVAARPDSRGIASKGIASLVAGFVLGAVLAFILEGFSAPMGRGNREQDEFRRLGGATVRDLRRPWRLLLPVKA
jgi:uncharacterized protein involved in exopolysaccharide biosynthesis